MKIKKEYDKLLSNLDQKFSKVDNPLFFDFYEIFKKDIRSAIKNVTKDFTVFSKEFENEMQKINKFIILILFMQISCMI